MQPSEIGLNITPYEIIANNLPRSFIANQASNGVGKVSIELASLYPAVGELRIIMAELLQDYYDWLDQIQNSVSWNSDTIDPSQVGLAINNLTGGLRDSGLVRNEEIGDIILRRPLQRIDAAAKYLTWEELVKLRDDLVDSDWNPGLVHGGFRPPHPGHTRLIRKISVFSTHTLVGFDPSWERRRVKKDDKIPFRIPLAAAMQQVASTPFVDHVFVLPICGRNSKERDKEMLRIYDRLGIRSLGVSEDNPLLPKFVRRMNQLGGTVILDELPRITSSTDIMKAYETYRTIEPFRRITDHFELFIALTDVKARKQGFLKDYPDQAELYDKARVLERLRATNTI